MNRTILVIAALLMFVSAPRSRVFILVNEEYLAHDIELPEPDGHKLVRYMREAMDEQGIKVYLLAVNNSNDCFDVWHILSNLYEEYHSATDPLEGVVLVGDLPVPTFHIKYRNLMQQEWELTAPCEYFYMDLWDNRSGAVYQDWEYSINNPDNPWERWNGTNTLARHNHPQSTYHGDDELEIWVSRVYASNLYHLRAEGAPWDSWLEEYEIIDAYFDKVHERMTTPVSGTRRGVAIGHPPDFPSLQGMADLDRIFQPANIDYFDNMADLTLNQAAAWQALLQSGRPGNINFGSYHGTQFNDAVYERNCETTLPVGSYEWAAVYAHSSWTYHGFHEYRNSGYDAGGGFFNINNAPSWTEHGTGGLNNGKYYDWDMDYVAHANAEWSAVIPDGMDGIWAVDMYWKGSDLNSETSYYYMHGDKDFRKIDNVAGEPFSGILDQTDETADDWHTIDCFHAEEFDTLVFVMAPNNAGNNGRCIADAVDFRLVYADEEWQIGVQYEVNDIVCFHGINYRCTSKHTSQVDWYPGKPGVYLWEEYISRIRVTPGNLAPVWDPNFVYYPVGECVSYENINYRCRQAHTSQTDWKPPIVPALWQEVTNREITPDDLFDISNRGNGGFRLKNWYNRSFCDMQDEPGGQSKVLFFEGIACAISRYTEPDNLALLYGMGHAGLTMIGNSFHNWSDNDYEEYTDALGPPPSGGGEIFGKAYLDYANRDFPDVRDNFILFGAGTLKESSY